MIPWIRCFAGAGGAWLAFLAVYLWVAFNMDKADNAGMLYWVAAVCGFIFGFVFNNVVVTLYTALLIAAFGWIGSGS